jgi:hypothetical protein
MIIDIKKGILDFSKMNLITVAKKLGATADQLPKEDEYALFIYDAEEETFKVAVHQNPDECYEAFNDICRLYEKKAFKKNSPYSIQFPRGCSELAENDEPCEDYGDLMMVWKYRKPYLFIQIQNSEYYGA